MVDEIVQILFDVGRRKVARVADAYVRKSAQFHDLFRQVRPATTTNDNGYVIKKKQKQKHFVPDFSTLDFCTCWSGPAVRTGPGLRRPCTPMYRRYCPSARTLYTRTANRPTRNSSEPPAPKPRNR